MERALAKVGLLLLLCISGSVASNDLLLPGRYYRDANGGSGEIGSGDVLLPVNATTTTVVYTELPGPTTTSAVGLPTSEIGQMLPNSTTVAPTTSTTVGQILTTVAPTTSTTVGQILTTVAPTTSTIVSQIQPSSTKSPMASPTGVQQSATTSSMVQLASPAVSPSPSIPATSASSSAMEPSSRGSSISPSPLQPSTKLPTQPSVSPVTQPSTQLPTKSPTSEATDEMEPSVETGGDRNSASVCQLGYPLALLLLTAIALL